MRTFLQKLAVSTESLNLRFPHLINIVSPVMSRQCHFPSRYWHSQFPRFFSAGTLSRKAITGIKYNSQIVFRFTYRFISSEVIWLIRKARSKEGVCQRLNNPTKADWLLCHGIPLLGNLPETVIFPSSGTVPKYSSRPVISKISCYFFFRQSMKELLETKSSFSCISYLKIFRI